MPALMIMASAAALLHSTMVSSGPLEPEGSVPGPMPQNGVWAMLPGDCEAPTTLDMTTWAKCAIPIGFLDNEVAALEKPGPGKKATPDEFYSMARTRFAMAPGASGGPAVAQVVVPMVFSRSYYYLAIIPRSVSDDGRFAEARGWPVACLPKAQGGCTAKTLADVQTQAAIEPTDPARLYRMIRIRAAETPPPADAAPPAAETSPADKAPIDKPADAPTPPAPSALPAAPSTPPPGV